MTNKEFIRWIGPIIQAEAKRRGYKIASVAIAQACLESNYGRSSLGSKYHNYFGMKCGSSWTGKSVNLSTKEEYEPGTLTTIKANFRVYDSMETGVKGYFDFISTKRYENLKSALTPSEYAERIKADGYATSTSYVQNLLKLVEAQGLTEYDTDKVETIAVIVEDPTDKIAREVIAGKWGNGLTRKQALTRAGYNYKKIQARVNDILRGR